MSKATGVPPHVKQLRLMMDLLRLCQTTLIKVNEQTDVLRQTIFDAMEERALDNGMMTRSAMVALMDEFKNSISEDVKRQLQNVQGHGIGPTVHPPAYTTPSPWTNNILQDWKLPRTLLRFCCQLLVKIHFLACTTSTYFHLL
jgi:hypothetical protein